MVFFFESTVRGLELNKILCLHVFLNVCSCVCAYMLTAKTVCVCVWLIVNELGPHYLLLMFVYFVHDCNSNFLCLQRTNKYS